LSDARGIYREVLRRMSRHLWRFVLAIVGVALGAGVEVLKPWPLKVLIDNVLSGKPLRFASLANYSRMNLLVAACVAGVLIYVLTGMLAVANNYISISIGQRMVNDLRGQLFDHLQRLSLGFHRRREIGDLMVRIVYDTFAIQTITMNGMFQILASSVLLLGMFIVMIKIDVTMTLIALGVIPMLVLLIASVSGTIDRLATGARIKESALYTVAHRALASIHVVQAFTREAESYREFVRSSSESLGENLRLYTFQSVYAGGVSVVIAIGTALVMYLGALHVMSAQLTIGGLIVFTSYLASLYAPINQIFQTYGQVQGAKAGLRRCLELLAIDPEIQDRAGARAMPRVRGEIEFEDVVFSYEAANPVLRGIRFTARAGESIAIVGPSGAGKTTMASLVMRFYEPARGSIKIDGQNLREVTLQSLRKNIAVVLQPPLVLGDTLRANITLGKPGASDEEIQRAASMARLDPVLAKLPRGFDELVGQGGHSLSEGEAQRVTIARALLKDAPILIMDEPTSALDTETESLVLAAVQEAMRGRTTLVIAHRLSTIQNADRILVLRDGVIEEQGSFQELLSRGGFFSYLYNLQSWKEPAAAQR
jgi:ATP-binding cassette subfamily B protein/subfamily B ATP-binding cassette protein MsbA